MECSNCHTSLCLSDFVSSEWDRNIEKIVFKCSVCDSNVYFEKPLFENDHINFSYLSLIVLDADSKCNEKYLKYIPEQQRNILFNHIEDCQICKGKIESIRLSKISLKINSDKELYDYFLDQSECVMKILYLDDIKIVKENIESFIYKGTVYKLEEFDKFWFDESEVKGQKCKRDCYVLKKNNYRIGIVSFIYIDNCIILERIWFKSESRLKQERKMIASIRTGGFKVPIDVVQRLGSFL